MRQRLCDIIAHTFAQVRGKLPAQLISAFAIGQPPRGKLLLSFAVKPVEQIFQVVTLRDRMPL